MPPARLRLAKPEDHGLHARFFAQLGTPDPPLERERWQKELAPTTAFLEDGGVTIGYACWEAAGLHVHVRHVVVDEAQRGRGFGSQLMHELAKNFRRGGARAWRLNVFAKNVPAIALYEKLGMRAVHSTAVLRLDWEHIPRLPQADSQPGELEPGLDAIAESRFRLLDGQLARARERSGVRLIAAFEGEGTLQGLAVFDPHYPGSFPFCCAQPVHARTLLSAMHESYEGAAPQVQTVVEDDAALVAHLERAGALRLKDILHMRGELP